MSLGDAFVEVHADTKPFAKELGKQLRTILKAAEPQIRKDSEGLGQALADGVSKRVRAEGEKIGRDFSTNVKKGWATRADDLLKEFAKPFERLGRGNFLPTRVLGGLMTGLIRGARGLVSALSPVVDIFITFGRLAAADGALIAELFKGLIGSANDIRSAMTTVASAMGQLGTAVGTLIVNVASSIPQLLAMAAAFLLLASVAGSVLASLLLVSAVLADLIGFLTLVPAVLSVIIAIILPLVVGFHQLGDAMQLVFEKDPDKLAKGLAKLSAPMRDLVRELRSVAPILKGIENATQSALIKPILETLAPTIRDLGPALTKGFSQVSSVVGIFIRDLLTLLDSPVFKQLLQDLFPATARIITSLSGPALKLIEAFAGAADKMLPTLEDLATKFGNMLAEFAIWLAGSIEDGSFQKFLDDAVASLTSIWALVKSLIKLFKDMFAQTNSDGRDFLDILTRAVNKFDNWINSPNGIQALQAAVDLAKLFAISLEIALLVAGAIFTIMGKIDTTLRDIIYSINILRGKGVTAVGGAAGAAATGGFRVATQYATGGFTPDTGATPAIVHPNEVIIPLTKPGRAAQLMQEAGLWNTGSDQRPINVYVGGKRLDEIVDYRIDRGSRGTALALSNGPRR